jgi:lipopolysaccharide export system ATP-binding protein
MYLRARSGISYLPQEPSIFRKLTVRQNLVAILETLDLPPEEIRQRTAAVLEEMKIAHLAGNPAYALSGGERRRAEIARALVIAPSFMLLDEPFSGIDPIAVADIQKIIYQLKAKGIGILMTDHNVQETLRITDRAYIIAEGRIFRKGSPDQLAADPEVRQVYLGANFRLVGRETFETPPGAAREE